MNEAYEINNEDASLSDGSAGYHGLTATLPDGCVRKPATKSVLGIFNPPLLIGNSGARVCIAHRQPIR
jgi:hypothetical protein